MRFGCIFKNGDLGGNRPAKFCFIFECNHRFKRRVYMEDKNVRIDRLPGEHLRASRPKVPNF